MYIHKNLIECNIWARGTSTQMSIVVRVNYFMTPTAISYKHSLNRFKIKSKRRVNQYKVAPLNISSN